MKDSKHNLDSYDEHLGEQYPYFGKDYKASVKKSNYVYESKLFGFLIGSFLVGTLLVCECSSIYTIESLEKELLRERRNQKRIIQENLLGSKDLETYIIRDDQKFFSRIDGKSIENEYNNGKIKFSE